MRRLVLVAALAGLALGGSSSGAQAPSLFAYDATAPLDVRQVSTRAASGARIVDLTYASPKGGRVPATLVLPAAEGRAPAVVFQHGAGDASRGDFIVEAQDLARAGVASLLVDAPFNRPPFRPWLTFAPRDRAAYVQNVVDLRRAVDLLATHPDVDAERIALVGFSYGGVLAGILAGLERRFDAVVVMSGPGRITSFLGREGQRWVRAVAPRARGARRAQLARYLAHMRAVDAYVRASPAARRVQFYPAGHLLCDCATRDRKAWLLEKLNAR